MSRIVKCRRVCAEPVSRVFIAEGSDCGSISLTVEEMESIRLCDYEGLEQNEAADRMGVSRGTLQRILYASRKKVAQAICQGLGIVIEGGNYEIAAQECGCGPKCRDCQFYHQDKGASTNE